MVTRLPLPNFSPKHLVVDPTRKGIGTGA
jgi:hypothetical protein